MSISVQVKSSNGIALVPIESRLLANRTVFIEGEITHNTACEFWKKIMVLNMEDDTSPISVIINSNGGAVEPGMQMYDVIQGSKAPIKTYCLCAYSMGAILFLCAKNGRFMFPNSKLMLHEPLLGNIAGSATSIRSISDSLLDTRNRINGIIAKHSGKCEEEVEKETSYDHYFTPQEAKDFNICDAIVDFSAILEG